MTLPEQRAAYLAHLGMDPDSIPGRACLRGEWDASRGFSEWRDQRILRAREEQEDG